MPLITSGGGGSAVTYDTSIGNGVDTLGIADLPLRPGANRYFAGNGGSDSNTGATHAQRFATLGKAMSLVTAGNGDQILLAEGSSFTEDWGTQTAVYPTTNGGNWLASKSGFSAVYPTVVQSYDPADPTNTAKYGRAYERSAWPTFTGPQTQMSNGTWGYFAVRGVKFYQGDNTATFWTIFGTASYILIEGCYFKNTQLQCQTGAATDGGPYSTPTNLIIRNNIFDTPWDSTVASGGTGRVGALFIDGWNGITWEDNFIYHNGWGASQTRSTVLAQQAQTHPIYESPDCTNFIGRRNLIIDPSADGGGVRGDGLLTENVLIGSPAGFGLGPPSTEITWRTDGLSLRASYNLVMAGIDFNPGVQPGGKGIESDLGKPGSSVDHNLIIRKDASSMRTEVAFSNISWGTTSYRSYMEFHHNIVYDWCDSGSTYFVQSTGAGPTYAIPYTTYDYNVWPDPASGTNTNTSTYTPTNAYTEAQLYVAAGYANKAALVAAMLANPTLHVQRTLRSLAFAGYNMPLDDAHRSDTVAPVLTSPVGTPTGTGTATIGATTDEGNGKIYWIMTTSATPPHVSQIKMGVKADHSAANKAGSISVSSTGAKTANVTSISAGTYYVHLTHEDAEGNKSAAVTSSSFVVS